MPRRKTKSFIRDVGVDIRFKSPILQKFINVVMKRGKKNLARSIVYDALDIIAKKTKTDEQKAFELFQKALRAVRPAVEVKSRRVGGGVYQVPIEVRSSRALSLSFRWILDAARKRNDKTMSRRLAQELMDVVAGQGAAVKKKGDVHRMAESNRAFSHYAW